MDRERWQRVDALFEAALDRPPAERAGFLDASCDGDDGLRREVEGLLAAAGKAGHFLAAPAAVGAADVGSEDAGDDSGATIGPYRVVREIGEGGMGTVYLAVRDDDAFFKQVAIKVLRPGTRSVDLVRRFRGERQILASLEHPNVARLLDGGATVDGRPYLVMEHIDGLPIDDYCDAHLLSVSERLEIFGQVCEAVHYAHQNLVVHRDVKPSNILVASDGVPRLLDFGIAKLLDPGAFPHTVEATRTGLRPMTPSYASPEQVRGDAVTTASDVYSLGVLLYQLLTGRLPYRLAGLPPREVDRVLCEVEPSKPSVAVGRAEEWVDDAGEPRRLTPERVAELRRARPQALRRRLAGDLDHIAAKALRKEVAARYGSVEQLLEDLRRHRDGLPVTARQDSLGYAVGKFLRRNRLAVAAAALVFTLLAVFAAAMAHQASLTARQRDRAERVTEFLIDLFEVVDPGSARGNTIKARELLDRGAERVARELGDQPEVQASLRHAIGTVYLNLGLYEDAAPLLEAVLAAREHAGGHPGGRPELAASLDAVAKLRRYQGRIDEAEALLRRALELRRRDLGADHPRVAEALRHLAIVLRIQGRYDEAEELGRLALATFERTLGEDHVEVAESSRVIAGALAARGENREAETFLARALAVYEEVYGDDHVVTGTTHQNFGYLYWARGELDRATHHYDRAVTIWERLLGPSHPKVADAVSGLGVVAKIEGRYRDAEAHYRRALAIYESAIEDHHTDVGNALYELGHVLLLEGRPAEAEPFLVRSLETREQALGAAHPWVAESLRGLADLRRAQDRLDEAEPLYRRALEIWRQHPGHPGTAGIPPAYAALLAAAGRSEEAATLLERVGGAS